MACLVVEPASAVAKAAVMVRVQWTLSGEAVVAVSMEVCRGPVMVLWSGSGVVCLPRLAVVLVLVLLLLLLLLILVAVVVLVVAVVLVLVLVAVVVVLVAVVLVLVLVAVVRVLVLVAVVLVPAGWRREVDALCCTARRHRCEWSAVAQRALPEGSRW